MFRVTGIYAASPYDIYYDIGYFKLKRVDGNADFKEIYNSIKQYLRIENKEFEGYNFRQSTTQIIQELRFDYISLYGFIVPILPIGIYSFSINVGKKGEMLRLIRLYNKSTLIAITKFDRTLCTNIFHGPVYIVNKDGEVFNKMIKTSVLTKSKRIQIKQRNAGPKQDKVDKAHDNYDIKNIIYDAEVYDAVFRKEEINELKIEDLEFLLEYIQGRGNFNFFTL